MKNFKQIIVLFLISILLIGNLVSCDNDMANMPKSLDDVKKLDGELSSRISNDENFKASLKQLVNEYNKYWEQYTKEQAATITGQKGDEGKSKEPYTSKSENLEITINSSYSILEEETYVFPERVELKIKNINVAEKYLNLSMRVTTEIVNGELKQLNKDFTLSYAGNYLSFSLHNQYTAIYNGFLINLEVLTLKVYNEILDQISMTLLGNFG